MLSFDFWIVLRSEKETFIKNLYFVEILSENMATDYKYYCKKVHMSIGEEKTNDDYMLIKILVFGKQLPVTMMNIRFKNDKFFWRYAKDESDYFNFSQLLNHIFRDKPLIKDKAPLELNYGISIPEGHPVRQLISQHDAYVFDANLQQFVAVDID